MTTLRIEISRDGDEVVVAVAGEIDLANADEVETAIVSAVDNEVAGLSVDVSEVGYLDSAGLRVFYALATRLRTLQIRFEIVAPPGSAPRQVIEIAGLDAVVAVTS